MKPIIFLLILYLIFTCKQEYKGEFGWRSIDQSRFGKIEEKIFQPREFYTGRKNLYFGENHTIWWIYQFQNQFVLKPYFIVVLYSEINSPQPVEIDLRVVQPEFQDGFYFLRQYYPPLEPGKYILKIAHFETQLPFDQVEFFVLTQKEIQQISGPISKF